jgi:hypothetical protein
MHSNLPETLTGPFCADHRGLPRYCSTVWIDVLNGHLAPSTRSRYASAADSLSSLGNLIDVAARHMSPQVPAALQYEGISKVSPHDFRHTSALIRAQRFMDAGMELEEALHRLRPFFGWKRSSDMPFHYAGAYFAPRHSKVWDETFERSLTALRAGLC